MAVRARPDNLALEDPAGGAGQDARRFDFAELWEHRESLQAVCARMAGDAGAAEDVVQDTFLRALLHADAGTLDRRESFGPWLATVARRRSIDAYRARRRLRPVAAMPDSETGATDDPAEQVLKQELVRRLRVALGELSTRERQLLLRQVTHGLSLAELAEEEDTSVASVRSVLSRARTKLRGSLERGGPLGVAPLPRLVAAVKRRLHRVAARIEGHAPMLTGAGAQWGEAVAAVVAAVALLLAGAPPVTRPAAAATQPSAVVAASPDAAAVETPAPESGANRSRTYPDSPASPSEPPEAPADPMPLPAPEDVWDAIPPLPPDAAQQPDQTGVISVNASSDGSAVFATAITGTSGEAAAFKSADGGTTWARIGGKYLGSDILVPPSYPASPTLFTTSFGQLLRSDNDGETFRVAAPAPLATGMAFSPDYDNDPRVVLATSPLTVYNPDDEHFTPMPVALPSGQLGDIVAGPDFAQSGRVFVAAIAPHETEPSASSVFECTNNGRCHRRTVLPDVNSTARLLDSKSTGLLVATVMRRLHVSSDGGQTFSPVALPPNFFVSTIADGGPGELLLGGGALNGQATLFRWAASTGTWTPLGGGTKLAQGTKDVVRLPSGRIIAVPGHGGGVLCSADHGVTWAPRCTA